MRNSKILKIICYITLPILIGIIILSTFYIVLKDATYYSTEEYFNSEDFLGSYMSKLSTATNRLIYRNPYYNSIKDGDTIICYTENGEFDYKKTNMYFLILYKNKAFTNVELTSEVSTVETIKNYISNLEGNQNFNIVNGKIETNSEILAKRAEQYLNLFIFSYYTINDSTYMTSDENIYIQPENAVDTYSYEDNPNINYYTTNIEDFIIYTSYNENFMDASKQMLVCKSIEMLRPYENSFYILMPICTALTVLILLYLIVSIGHKKGTKGIATSDFDKIPLEIIGFIGICIIGLVFILLAQEVDTTEFELIISLLFTVYFTIFIVGIIIFDTIIKRIKSRTFWKTTLVGKIVIILLKPIHKFEKLMEEVIKERFYGNEKKIDAIEYWYTKYLEVEKKIAKHLEELYQAKYGMSFVGEENIKSTTSKESGFTHH